VNVREYISSGIVESYVLGLADEAERAEFESMCAVHEEVRAARNAFELALEQQATVGSVLPPQHIKARFMSEIAAHSSNPLSATNTAGTVITSDGPVRRDTPQTPLTPLAPLTPVTPWATVTTNYWSKYLAAASVVLLIGSTVLNFYLFKQYQEYSERYSGLLASQTELANNNKALQTSIDTYRNTIARLKDPEMSVIRMAGSNVPNNGSPDPRSVATIYWNKHNSEVYLLVNNLPAPTAGKQYQLWAIVGGKPVSAGVFNMDQPDIAQKMISIPAAEAFAVTLEKQGGNPVPQGAMYVLGAI
jgi:anti-sigma-K factor RskA